ncbi:MAG: hypothetical protein NTY48_04735 [Candidatus Diapherotrites archaeon]|nr:hypothetical protein [Candidatus Diapherotrites archaeon]
MLSAKAVIYSQGIKISLMAGKATLFGSHKKLKEFLDTKIVEQIKQQEGMK